MNRLTAAALMLALLLAAPSARAQYTQQGPKLVGSGGMGMPYQGYSIAISADGNTLAVGARNDNSFTGATWVYTRSGGAWSQQGPKLVGTGAVGAAVQGNSVALSADGNTLVAGGPDDNNFAGAVWVYTRSGGVWSQEGAKLVGTGTAGTASQGRWVAVSADGNTILVGGPRDNGNGGAAWVFTRTEGVWSQQGTKLVGTGAVGGARQGLSVALSGDGNTALLGGISDNSSSGAAWVFTRSEGVWSQQGPKLVGSDAVGAATQGISVALSADGNTAVVGGEHDNSILGAAWVYTRAGGVWSQQGPKLVGTNATNSQQGHYVAVTADGNIVASGGFTDNFGQGATWVFTRSGGVWSQQGAKLVGTGGSSDAAQGLSVAISAIGNTIAVGGGGDNISVGAAWVFVAPFATGVAPADRPLELALEGPWPNPAAPRDLTVRFVLPAASPAQLELFDVTGRRVAGRDVGRLGPGPHSVNLAEGESIRAGLYFVRLVQGASERVTRVTVLRQ